MPNKPLDLPSVSPLSISVSFEGDALHANLGHRLRLVSVKAKMIKGRAG
jgi:hypothetical protein